MENKNVSPLEFHGNENDSSSSSEEKVAPTKRRSVLSQCLACSAANLIKLSFGSLFGFTTLLIGELYKENSEIKVTTDQLSWYSSFCFMVPVGALVIALLSHHIGNRRTILLTFIVCILCGILYYFVTEVNLLLIIQALVGLTYSVPFISGSSYVVEVTEPHLRSAFLACGILLALSAIFFSVLLGTILYWRTVALVNLAFPIIGLIVVCLIPESPHWLASKGKIDEAEKSLAWLRGWTTPEVIRNELLSILKDKDNSKSVHLNNSKNKSKLKEQFKPYLQRSFMAPLAIVCYMFLIHVLSGSLAISTYAIPIFEMLQSPIDKHVSIVIYDALCVLGAFICVIIIQFTGKRVLMFTSIVMVALCYFTIAVVSKLVKEDVLSSTYLWVPTIAMQVATFFLAGGFDKIVYMYNVELFPTQFRSIGSGIGYFVRSVIGAIGNKYFFYMISAMTIEGVFIFFGILNVLGLATFYFLLPETNGKTLEEIEDYFNGSKKSRQKSGKE